MDTQKKILIIAGPNGAGKTTFAANSCRQLEDCPLLSMPI